MPSLEQWVDISEIGGLSAVKPVRFTVGPSYVCDILYVERIANLRMSKFTFQPQTLGVDKFSVQIITASYVRKTAPHGM